jgi:isoquinoline 1-oxidoreductase beta subunit
MVMPKQFSPRPRRVIESEYLFPYLAHAPMEPLDGYLEWNAQGALARLGSQLQTIDHQVIAKVLGLGPEKVTVETMLGGGSFGRRAQPSSELAVELAEVAKAIGPNRPVKLVRTREDDLSGGYYRRALPASPARRGEGRQDRRLGAPRSSASPS